MTARETEQAKLKANYWNGLAIATVAIGALPFFIGVSNNEATRGDIGLYLVEGFGALFFAACLSRVFHNLALRAVSKL